MERWVVGSDSILPAPCPSHGGEQVVSHLLCLPSWAKLPPLLFSAPWERPLPSRACEQTLTSPWHVPSLALVAPTGKNNGHCIPLSPHLDSHVTGCPRGAAGSVRGLPAPLDEVGCWARPAQASCLPASTLRGRSCNLCPTSEQTKAPGWSDFQDFCPGLPCHHQAELELWCHIQLCSSGQVGLLLRASVSSWGKSSPLLSLACDLRCSQPLQGLSVSGSLHTAGGLSVDRVNDCG